MYEKELEALLPRCFEMYEFMAAHIEQLQKLGPVPEIKYQMAFSSGLLTFEHGLSSLKLIDEGLISSGFALKRPQYESLVRGFWFMHVDTDAWVAKLRKASTIGPSELRKLETPMMTVMLKELAHSDVPVHILAQLNSFRTLNNTPFNSFTHSGLIALLSSGAGYEPKMIYDSLRNCNAVSAINMQMMSNLTGCEEAMKPVSEMHPLFTDCLPIVHG